ncbi:golgin candidate 3-like, partial [Vigna umbellata]|uniref:golgin candidate 3-like n=1 Tax=Vigna umbellata TaxID=87088 RepID=UPI001F5F251A
IEQYKAEIKKLQASEAEIKALSVNYAALLKEKEDHIVKLNKENGSLKQNLEATNAALRVSRIEGSGVSTNGTLYSQGKYRSKSDAIQSEMEFKHSNVTRKFAKKSMEVNKIHNELNEQVSEIKHLQLELTKRENEAGEAVDSLKRFIKTLEKENTTLKMEKNEIEAALENSRKFFTDKMMRDASHTQEKDSSSVSDDMPDNSKSFPEKEEMERSLDKLSKDLNEAQRDRDKAVQELNRLKQHLLEKASEESDKMDEDSKIIEELRDSNTYLTAQVSHLERTLKQALASQEELKMANNSEILKSREVINDLNMKLTNCMSTIDAKNIELLNLQTALGQYYAEIESKEHLERELAHAREEIAKLSQLLKVRLFLSLNI